MRKTVLLIVGIVMVCCSCVSLGGAYSSSATLHYDGNTKEFTYSDLDSEDLFDDFKDLIPGDVRTQRINISAHNINSRTKIYLKLNNGSNKELLEHINIYCYVNGELLKENDDIILINQFDNDNNVELETVVEVPIEVGNEIAGLSYSLLWTFMAEEDGEWVAEAPDTGANSMNNSTVLGNISWVLLAIGIGATAYGIWRTTGPKKRTK